MKAINRTFVTFIFIVILALFFIGCGPSSKIVTISSSPPNATLLINGVLKGKTPVTEKFEFPEGKQSYYAELKALGYQDTAFYIKFAPDTQTIYHCILRNITKHITITSNPSGASVSYSGIEKGKTPFTDTLIFDKMKTLYVLLKLEGYKDTLFQIGLEPESQTVYNFNLEKIESKEVVLIQFIPQLTNIGVKLTKKERITLAYLEVIERSPNVKSVTKVTDNQDSSVNIENPVMSPTDNTLMYTMYATDENEKSYCNIWKQTVGSFGKTRITFGTTLDLYPAFSPDGNYVYFSSNRTSDNPTIWRVKSEGGGGITKITNTSAEDYGVSMFSDGKSFAYTSNPPSANEPQIWTISTSGSLPTQLREGAFPEVSPDNTRILFTREDKNNYITRGADKFHPTQIWTMNVDGSGETQLTQNIFFNTINPKWSPDGQWIAFVSDEGKDSKGINNYDIWIMRADGSDRTQLTTNGSWDDSPCWSSDGKIIYFRSNRGGYWNVWRFEPILAK